MSVNVSVCLCVIVLTIRFAFSFALESLRHAGKEEGNKTVAELPTNDYKCDDLSLKSLSPPPPEVRSTRRTCSLNVKKTGERGERQLLS